MFRKKQKKRIVELSPAEVRLMLTALMHFRNKAMNAGKPTEDINDLILSAENEIIDELKEKLYTTPPLEFLFDSQKTFERIIRLIDEYDDKIFMLLSSDGDPNFLMRLRKEATVFVDSLLSTLGAELKVPSEYLVVYISSAVGGLLGHWYENGKQESLEEVIEMGHQMLKSGFYGMILRT